MLHEVTEIAEGRPTVMILRKDIASMDSFVQGMSGELASGFNLLALAIDATTTPAQIGEALAAGRPDVVVLLDNPTVELYRRYQQASPDRSHPPAIIAMALFVEQLTQRIHNATGIAYEVPAVTSLVRLRATGNAPVRRVGVIHRPLFASFVASQSTLAEIEGFEIVPFEVGSRVGIGRVRRALKQLDKLGIDALWILNDNALLTPEVLLGAWMPLLERYDQPVVVGVSSLLSTQPPVGSFAVLPDHVGLGMQTAELIYELSQDDFVLAERATQQPIAVEIVLNRSLMDRHGELDEATLDRIDRIVE